MTRPELIEILKATGEGKVIQALTKHTTGAWFTVPVEEVIERLRQGYELRIKPEPREWWAAVYGQSGLQGGLWATKKEAEEYNAEREVIRVREVIDP